MQGFGFDRDRLIEAGIEEAGAVAAVTSGDNSNILIARVARESFGVEHVVARIYDPRRAAIYQRLGIPTVATVAWTTDQVLRRLLPEAPAAEWIDPTGKVVPGRARPRRRLGRPPAHRARRGRRRAAWWRSTGWARPRSRRPSTVAQEGDVLYVAAETAARPSVDGPSPPTAEGALR